jgi:hypothetical protein
MQIMSELLILKYEPLQPTLYDDLKYRAGNFADQLRLLRESGYTSIKAADLVAHIHHRRPLPQKSLLITFDSGYAADYEYGVPALINMGFNAIFFVAGEYILKSTDNDPAYALEFMNLQQVRSLHTHGFDIGLQTFSDLNLHDHSLTDIVDDIEKNIAFFRRFNLSYSPVFAIKDGFRVSFFNRFYLLPEIFRSFGFEIVFQCTKRLNKVTFSNNLYLNRIQIDQAYPIQKLKLQINKSRSKWFE